MDTTPTLRRDHAPAWDMAAVSLISLWLAYWFIPAHVPSVDALGLPPELLPTACALCMAVLSAIGFLLSWRKGTPALPMSGVPWFPIIGFIVLCMLGVVIISMGSLSIGALYLVPILMRRLGERRLTRTLPIAAVVAALIHFLIP